MLITTPESLQQQDMQEALKRSKVSRVIIDEAHCCDEWGHQFRPAYLRIKSIVKDELKVPCIAMTATTTKQGAMRIQTLLGLHDPFVIIHSFRRDNLFLHVKDKSSFQQAAADIRDLLQTSLHKSSVILYCQTPAECDKIATFLLGSVRCVTYHGQMSPLEKHNNLIKWKNNEVHVIVATKSLGQGIDKPDVRGVIHLSFPESIPEYYQQVGRGGRDSSRADCFLYFKFSDRSFHLNNIYKMSDKIERRNSSCRLTEIISLFTSRLCLKEAILKYFGEENQSCCNNTCSNCMQNFSKIDVTDVARQSILLLQGAIVKCKYVNMSMLAKLLKGSKDKDILSKGLQDLPLYGSSKKLSLSRLENILVALLVQSVLCEENRSLFPGDKAHLVMDNKYNVYVYV